LNITLQNGAADSTTQSLVVESGGGAIRLTVEGLTDDWAYTMDSAQQVCVCQSVLAGVSRCVHVCKKVSAGVCVCVCRTGTWRTSHKNIMLGSHTLI